MSTLIATTGSSSTPGFPEQDWNLKQAAAFRRTDGEFGGLSNMSRAFPLVIFAARIRSSEHLYQAMRFGHEPEIQNLVIAAKTPMFAKKCAREWDFATRPDWLEVRVDVMRWVLQVKLAQNATSFGRLLEATGKRPIVENSRYDSFWGAGPVDSSYVRGRNVLGCLLMELRAELAAERTRPFAVPAPRFPKARLSGIEVCELSPAIAPPLVAAHDLRAMGFPAGRAYGAVLAACHQRQLAGRVQDRDAALNLARQIWIEHASAIRSIDESERQSLE